jgi:hypothetical protein
VTNTRLVGSTAENIFLSLLNEANITAHVFDATSFDGIVFDMQNEYFKVGNSPFFIQTKCRGSKKPEYNSQGHAPSLFAKIEKSAKELGINKSSLYFVVGFYKKCDIREICYFIIPFSSLGRFRKGNHHYRFSVKKCEEIMRIDSNIVRV